MLRGWKQKIGSAWPVLRMRGVGYVAYLLAVYIPHGISYCLLHKMPRRRLRRLGQGSVLAAGILLVLVGSLLVGFVSALGATVLLVALGGALAYLWKQQRLRQMQRRAYTLTEAARSKVRFTSWIDWPIEPDTRRRVEAHRQGRPGPEVVLARIDNDGRVLGLFGHLPWLDPVEEHDFVERRRFPLDIVLLDGKVLVRKDFRSARERFVREWYNLALLQDKATVPAVYLADEARCVLYKNLVPGRTIRSHLVAAGARILTVQTEHDPSLDGLDAEARIRAVWARGRAVLPDCLPEAVLWALEHQMDGIHAAGVARLSLTFGNVVIEEPTGTPWLIDMEGAQDYRSTASPVFGFRRDEDRQKFNAIYGRALLTETSVRQALCTQLTQKNGWYAPIDFGGGLTVGNFWSTESGTGRWEVLNREVVAPLVRGKRVLDLGSNNGLLPLLMLRAGAAEVTGVERDLGFVERARLVHRIFEWRDLRAYAFEICQADMLEAVRANPGSYDVVTAFCSLYYLRPEAMGEVVQRAACMAPVMIVQANDGTREEAADDKAEKSSTAYLEQLLRDNGYAHVQTYAPQGYRRPLLVGKIAGEGTGSEPYQVDQA